MNVFQCMLPSGKLCCMLDFLNMYWRPVFPRQCFQSRTYSMAMVECVVTAHKVNPKVLPTHLFLMKPGISGCFGCYIKTLALCLSRNLTKISVLNTITELSCLFQVTAKKLGASMSSFMTLYLSDMLCNQ